MKVTRNMTTAALLLALSVILPMAAHVFNVSGLVLLPMHLPILLAGFLLGPQAGGLMGAVAPAINFFLTGSPPVSPPIMPMMVFELASYGIIAGLAYKHLKLSVLPSLVFALIGGRIALALAAWAMVVFVGFQAKPIPFVTGSIVTGLPGIAFQVVFIPLLLRALRSSSTR